MSVEAYAWIAVGLLVLYVLARLLPCSHENLSRPFARDGKRWASCFDCGATVAQPSLEIRVNSAGRQVTR